MCKMLTTLAVFKGFVCIQEVKFQFVEEIPSEKVAHHRSNRDVHGHYVKNATDLPYEQIHFECEDLEQSLAIQPANTSISIWWYKMHTYTCIKLVLRSTNLSTTVQRSPNGMFYEVNSFLMSQATNNSYQRKISPFQTKSLLQGFLGCPFAFNNIFWSVRYLKYNAKY